MRPWEAEQPLSELTLYADWDEITSMILSLRIHLFEYGTVPTWNFMFCGGRPELSTPYSWAYTWPAVFGYLLPPFHAIVAVWITLTLVGFFSTRALLSRFAGSSLGANAGAALYVLSGCFATRFNAGHVTFAFFHLVPLLILLFDLGFERALLARRLLAVCLWTTLATFLFATGGLPQPLFYFYPAFILFAGFRVLEAARMHDAARAVRAAAVPVTAHLLGFWLAAYKLWPVTRWQLEFPRAGVGFESYSVAEVVLNTLIFVRDYFGPVPQQAWHVYPPWGYNAFVGPIPWLLAGAVAAYLAIRSVAKRSEGSRDGTARFALVLVASGIALAIGNDNPMSPAYLFRHLPLLEGIRAFNRYLILVVFGLAILVAHSFSIASTCLNDGRGVVLRRLALPLLAGAVIVPVAIQFGFLVWNIGAKANAEIVATYHLTSESGAPQQIWNRRPGPDQSGHQTSLLEQGYWVVNCYSNIKLPATRPTTSRRPLVGLSSPPPERLSRLHRDGITLRYLEGQRGDIDLKLPVYRGFEFDVPVRRSEWSASILDGDLDSQGFTMTAKYPGPFEGALASLGGLLVSAAFFSGLARADSGSAGNASSDPDQRREAGCPSTGSS